MLPCCYLPSLCISIYICTYIRTYIHTNVCVCVCVYVCMCCKCVCLYVYVCVYGLCVLCPMCSAECIPIVVGYFIQRWIKAINVASCNTVFTQQQFVVVFPTLAHFTDRFKLIVGARFTVPRHRVILVHES